MTQYIFAIGDIHGRVDLLEKAEPLINNYLAEREGVGTVVTLGDYIDRGPNSREVIEYLMEIEQKGSITCLKGNHESLMLDALSGRNYDLWLMNGGGATLSSYPNREVFHEHVEWVSNLPSVAHFHNHLFVHAGFMPGVPLEEQEEDVVQWIRDRFLLAEKDFKDWPHIVHGHTPIHPWKPNPAKPELLSWRTNLDTGAFYTGVLTIGVFVPDQGPPVDVISVTH